jgi:hypothetical protein
MILGENPIEQRRLAGTQEAGQNCDWDFGSGCHVWLEVRSCCMERRPKAISWVRSRFVADSFVYRPAAGRVDLMGFHNPKRQ